MESCGVFIYKVIVYIAKKILFTIYRFITFFFHYQRKPNHRCSVLLVLDTYACLLCFLLAFEGNC